MFPDGTSIVSGAYDKTVKIWGTKYYVPDKSVLILLMKAGLIEDVARLIIKYCRSPLEELKSLWKQRD